MQVKYCIEYWALTWKKDTSCKTARKQVHRQRKTGIKMVSLGMEEESILNP